MTLSMQDAVASTEFAQIISRDGWTVAQVGACIKRYAAQTQTSDEQVCRALLAWVNAVPQVGEHATGRRFTRLQLMENSLSHAGFALTLRDFAPWFGAMGQDWRPDELLPYAPQDLRLVESEARVAQLEHELHQMQVTANRTRAEVDYVVAERKHYMAVVTQEIHQLVSQDYETSASWRVTKPLRRAMNWSREMKASLRGLLRRAPKAAMPGDAALLVDQPDSALPASKPRWASLVAPWDQPGYSTETAWRTQAAGEFDRKNYTEWVRRYDTPTQAALADLQRQGGALANQPKILLLMQVTKADGTQLDQVMASISTVQAQTYPHWELCLAVAADVDPVAQAALVQVAEQDARIKPVMAEADLLGAVTGDWVVLLNAVDLIAPQALFMLANAVIEHPDWRIIYSDSDALKKHGFERCQPNFKPDWDVDLFYAQNYTEHLCAFDVQVLKQAGGMDAEFTAVSSFEWTLRCLAHLQAGDPSLKPTATTCIGHLPHVLYHARILREPDTRDQRQAVLTAHFARCDVAAKVTVVEHGLRIQYALPEALPMVSLIIPTKNNAKLLYQCLDSLLNKTTYANYEVLVVDNGSDASETLDYLQSLASEPRIRVIRDSYTFNYSALNNAAVLQVRGEIVGLVNDDIEIKNAEWLSEMVSQVLRPGVGAVGARLWYPDLTLQHAGMVLVGGIARHVHKHLQQGEPGFCDRAVMVQSFAAVTGACLLVKKELYMQVGGLNERELGVGFNDVDFCLRLVEAGYRNVWTPYAELFHHESATRGHDDPPEKQRRAEQELRYMHKRWGVRMILDPAYNPNLTDGHDDFSLAWPPRQALAAS